MHLHALELHRLRLPLVEPWVTSSSVFTGRDLLVVHATFDGVDGWGECAALGDASYSPEFVDAAAIVIERFAAPALLEHPGELAAADVAPLLGSISGHRMAKAALEMAVLDAEARAGGVSLSRHLGGERTWIDAGVSIPLHDTLDALLDTVDGHVEAGYRRVKLKIEPGLDVDWVRAVRRAHPDLALQVDANGAYTIDDAEQLARLDECDLLLIEQPLGEDDLLGHAELARRLTTPICLDEALVSLHATRTALALGACEVVNLKAGRVGGLLEAVRIHDHCRAEGVALWCGGMLESGIGRAANLALGSLPGCTLPGDMSASARFYERDLVADPAVLVDGRIEVPAGPGLGVVVDLDAVAAFATAPSVVIRRP